MPSWRLDDTYDWTEVDARARAILEGNPHAIILPRVHLCSPPWWDELHPEELVVWDEEHRERPFFRGYTKQTCASWSSRRRY